MNVRGSADRRRDWRSPGTRNGFLGFVAFHIITMLVAAASPNMTFLIVVRVFMGIALGGLRTVLFASWTEYVPSRDRGSWSSRASFIGNWSYPICSLIASFLVGVTSPEANWRIQFIIPAITSTIVLIIVWRLFPESPRWLETKGRYREANELLDQIEAEVQRRNDITLEPAAAAVEAHAKVRGRVNLPYSALFKGELLKRVIVGSFALIAMNVIQYTLINWLPTMPLSQGIDLADSVVLNTMSMFGAPIGIFIAVFIIDRFPRRVFGIGLLLIIAALGYVYSLQMSMTALSIVGFLLIIFVYMFVCFASAVYVPEIWPTAQKMRGLGIANSIGRIVAIASPYLVAWLLTEFGVIAVFMVLGLLLSACALVLAIFGIETRGRSVEEMALAIRTAKAA
ncbi:MFS transporter [Actinomyces sp.]|uniref:MFS transporter n=1 Tax=Actinomyces sp. TaxID=29317 RepID=UPI0026DC97D1|nr:MFS transporter [Actinomyces sp.]MDO4901527.1 MFS transporter [Actinomyces sp.]